MPFSVHFLNLQFYASDGLKVFPQTSFCLHLFQTLFLIFYHWSPQDSFLQGNLWPWPLLMPSESAGWIVRLFLEANPALWWLTITTWKWLQTICPSRSKLNAATTHLHQNPKMPETTGTLLDTFVMWQWGSGEEREKLHQISKYLTSATWMKHGPLWMYFWGSSLIFGRACAHEGDQEMVKPPLLIMLTFPNNIFLGAKVMSDRLFWEGHLCPCLCFPPSTPVSYI